MAGCTDGTIQLLDERPRLGRMGDVWLGWWLRRCVPSLFLFSLFEVYLCVSTNIRHRGCPVVINDLCGSGGGPHVLNRREVRRWHGCRSCCSQVIFSLVRRAVEGGGEDRCRLELRRRTGLPVFFEKTGNLRLAAA